MSSLPVFLVLGAPRPHPSPPCGSTLKIQRKYSCPVDPRTLSFPGKVSVSSPSSELDYTVQVILLWVCSTVLSHSTNCLLKWKIIMLPLNLRNKCIFFSSNKRFTGFRVLELCEELRESFFMKCKGRERQVVPADQSAPRWGRRNWKEEIQEQTPDILL